MTPVDLSAVDHGEISKMYKRPIQIIDSLAVASESRRLTLEQIQKFADIWNTATYQGVCKFKSKYFIDLYFKNGTKRTFQINGSIKEIRDYCYEPSDKKYLKDLWKNAETK